MRRAQKMFSEVPENLGCGAARLVALLTDGRVDSHQAREAVTRAARMADELDNFELYAFGVGRGVDADALNRIACAGAGVGVGEADSPERVVELSLGLERYMPLRILEEPDDW